MLLGALGALGVAMIAMAGFALLADDADPSVDAIDDEPVATRPDPPVIAFPDDLRSNDLSLNQAIDRFIRITREGRYGEFRQLWTRREDPISAEKYKAVWTQLREARVKEVRPLPASPGGEAGAYLIRIEVRRDAANPSRKKTGELRLKAVREAGEWVFGLYAPVRAAGGAASASAPR